MKLELQIIKRNGEAEPFDINKIKSAITKAFIEVHPLNEVTMEQIGNDIEEIASELKDFKSVGVEHVQDVVETQLMKSMPGVAKRYILYREERAKLREKGWQLNELQQSIWENKYRHGSENHAEWVDRVGGNNERIKKRIRNKEFLFGGRILANRGLQHKGLKVTYSNCYVLSPPADNIESIWGTAGKMARTYSFGGGVGISLRNIRPRDARVHNNARTTSGAVSFMPLYSLTTETIGQNGRRGALMLSIPSSHPDLEEFIDVKTENGAITGANISIEIDDAFMFAVKNQKPYRLHFTVEDTGEVIEKTVDAKALYEKIIRNNWDWAEPGMLYWDRISNYHFMSADPEFEFAGTNPCAEEPLPAGGSCLLGSINLSAFVIAPFTEQATFDFQRFGEAVADGVIALNEVLDEGLPLHPLEEQRISVGELRQIGLGVMGIGEMLIKLGITFGSTKSLAISEVISHIMLNQAVETSAMLAKELGTFGRYNWEHIKESEFFQKNVVPEVQKTVEQYGLRNSQILCIAPTGSISTMLGISGGIEPIFALSFNRTTKSLHAKDVTYKVYTEIVKEYYEAKGLKEGSPLPEYFITSHTLPWKNRIEMQAVWQSHIDASISSTVNLPNDITIEETMELYMYAWEMGLKGCTIYRDGCKRGGILTLDDDDKEPLEDTQDTPEQVTGFFSKCIECESDNMVFANGCATCQDCGFSPC